MNLHPYDTGSGDLPRMGYHSAGRPGARKSAEPNAWHNPQSYLPDCFEMLDGHWAMPQAARAADASHSSLLRVSTKSGIAIAVITALYFGGQLLRVFL